MLHPGSADALLERIDLAPDLHSAVILLPDPGLEFLVKEVSPVLNFTGFTLLKRAESTLGPSDQVQINLPEKRTLLVQFLEFSENKARVSVRILENDLTWPGILQRKKY